MQQGHDMLDAMRLFWQDQKGSIELSSWIVLIVMVALGLIVGLSNMRMEMTQQFGDVAQALESIDQSYSYTVNNVTSTYSDSNVFGAPTLGNAPAGLEVNYAGYPE